MTSDYHRYRPARHSEQNILAESSSRIGAAEEALNLIELQLILNL